MSSGKGAAPRLWLHWLEHGHCQRQLQPLLQRKHFCCQSDLHGSLWSLLHCSHWWNHYNVEVTTENVVIRGLWIDNVIVDFTQVLLLEPTFPAIWKTPHTQSQRWMSGTSSIPASFPLFREHCWPLLAPMSPTCTLVFRCSRQAPYLLISPFFFRLALSLPTRPVGWRRSTCSSTTKVTWTVNVTLPIRLAATVHHLRFQNGSIALMQQIKNEIYTRPSSRWDWLKLTNNIYKHHETGRRRWPQFQCDALQRSLWQLGYWRERK